MQIDHSRVTREDARVFVAARTRTKLSVAAGVQNLAHPFDLPLLDHDVEVAKFAQRDASVRVYGKDGTLEWQGVDALTFQSEQHIHQLAHEKEILTCNFDHLIAQLLEHGTW